MYPKSHDIVLSSIVNVNCAAFDNVQESILYEPIYRGPLITNGQKRRTEAGMGSEPALFTLWRWLGYVLKLYESLVSLHLLQRTENGGCDRATCSSIKSNSPIAALRVGSVPKV